MLGGVTLSDWTDLLRGDLERRRGQERTPQCLPDVTLAALADGSLGELADRERDHLAECLRCLYDYASLRSLVDAAAPGGRAPARGAEAVGASAGTRTPIVQPFARVRRPLAVRIPAGWAAMATAAAMVLTWVVSTQPWRSADTSSITEFSTVRGERTVAGTVRDMEDKSTSDAAAYVVHVQDAEGSSFTVFAWGRPTVAVGDRVHIVGTFFQVDSPGAGRLYQGVASSIRRSR